LSYNTLIQKEGIKQNYLIVMVPKRNITSWTLFSGTTYYNDFDYGNVVKVTSDDVELTEGSSTTLAANEWYYDVTNERLYVNITSIATKYVVIFYELFYGTQAAHHYRVPTDDSTRVVYWDPIINKPPQFKSTLADSITGYMPSQGSTIVLNNGEHTLEKHMYSSSFKNASISVYHWLGDLDVDNIKKRYITIGDNISYSDTNVTFSIRDRIDILDLEFRSSVPFYNTTLFPSLDVAENGYAIRTVFGVVNEALLTNLDYENESPTTSDNRVWGVRAGALNQVTKTVPASPVSTTTRTYSSDNVNGMNVGDNVLIDKATDEYVIITAIGSNYIEHAALVSGAATTGDTFVRPTVAKVEIEQSGVIYRALYNRDYTEAVSSGIVQITFDASMETNLSMSTLTSVEPVFARIYGKANDNTIGGSPFGSDSTTYAALTDPAVILYDLLRDLVDEADINTTSFTTLSGLISGEEVGFSIPQDKTSLYPTYKELMIRLFTSNLIQLFLDNDLKWEVSRLAPLGSDDVSIEEDEIIDKSLSYRINYNDIINKLFVEYDYKEYSTTYNRESYDSDTASYLHEIEKQETFISVLLESSDASTLAKRLSFIYGDRSGIIRFKCKNRFQDNNLIDIIEVGREKHPGFDYVEGTVNTRDYIILEVDKALNEVTIGASDNKGLEDNSGDF
jgi:hypothetical protein